MRIIVLISSVALCASACSNGGASRVATDAPKNDCQNPQYSEVLSCYHQNLSTLPPTYALVATTNSAGVAKRSYQMTSQLWQPGLVEPAAWNHNVDIYIPDHARTGRALLVINNGLNNPTQNSQVQAASDFSEDKMRSVSEKTQTIVISVNNVPNQYLQYADDPTPKKEDDSVAHSWKLFLAAPTAQPYSSVHIPMMEAAVKAMDLAQAELGQWNIQGFIVTGASKRGWAAWHVAIADTRVDAIVPFVFDGLNTRTMLKHTYRVYGDGWPIALRPYINEGVLQKLDTNEFASLMQIEDPLSYRNSSHADRLSIQKYLVNASGDDFFVPDNARFYIQNLAGDTVLRVAPNSSHVGIKDHIESALIPFVNRIQNSIALPNISAEIGAAEPAILSLQFSEQPIRITKWVATNQMTRDFRFACGVRYLPTTLNGEPCNTLHVSLNVPDHGWQATFIEAQFSDGLTATTRVYVTPDLAYPDHNPTSDSAACQVI